MPPDFAAPNVSFPETQTDDPRLGRLLGAQVEAPETAEVAIVGFPSDDGVRINGGRPGAAEGPEAIRRQLYKLTPDPRRYQSFTRCAGFTLDLGDLQLTDRVETNQQRLGKALGPLLRRGTIPIVLGGGHETAYGHFLGYVQAEQTVSILNWDAHPDVRPLREGRAHSGSPFRQALEHESGRLRQYTIAGLQPQSTARAHLSYLNEQNARYLWHDDLTSAAAKELYRHPPPLMVSFDLDALDQCHAPGVSAPAAGGLTASFWLEAAYHAGRSPSVTSIEISECNPRFDRDQQTARLAALTVWQFLCGLCERK